MKNYYETFIEVKKKFIDHSFKPSEYKSIFWNSWEDVEETIGEDYCFGVIDHSKSQCLVEATVGVSQGPFMLVSDLGESPEEQLSFYKLDKTVKDLMLFQEEGFLSSGMTSKLFIFDESASWLVHVDESVYVVGEDVVMDNLVSCLGGATKVIDQMRSEMGVCSGDAKIWREPILKNFEAITSLNQSGQSR